LHTSSLTDCLYHLTNSLVTHPIGDAPEDGDEVLAGKLFLFVYTGILHRQPVYRRAKELGCRMVFLDSSKPQWMLPYAEDWIHCADPGDPEQAIQAVGEYLKNRGIEKFDAVMTFDEYGLRSCSKLNELFSAAGAHTGIPYDTLMKIKNKHAFRAATSAAGVAAPRNLRFSLTDLVSGSLDEEFAKFKFPVVLKPISGAGSHFVRRVATLDDLKVIAQEYIKEARECGDLGAWGLAQDENAIQSSFMVEEMIVGQEVDIDLLVQRGKVKFLSVSDNFPTSGPKDLFMEIGGCCPSRALTPARLLGLAEMTHRMVSAFGEDLTGCFHFEAISAPTPGADPATDRGTAYPIELNMRLGGSEVHVLMLTTYSINLGIHAMKLALGVEIPTYFPRLFPGHEPTPEQLAAGVVPLDYHAHATSINFLSTGSGYITKIGYDRRLFEDSAYCGSMTRCGVGHPLKAPPLGFDFLGWMVARGNTPEDSAKNLERCTRYFHYTYTPYSRDDPHGYIPGTKTYYLDHVDD